MTPLATALCFSKTIIVERIPSWAYVNAIGLGFQDFTNHGINLTDGHQLNGSVQPQYPSGCQCVTCRRKHAIE